MDMGEVAFLFRAHRAIWELLLGSRRRHGYLADFLYLRCKKLYTNTNTVSKCTYHTIPYYYYYCCTCDLFFCFTGVRLRPDTRKVLAGVLSDFSHRHQNRNHM